MVKMARNRNPAEKHPGYTPGEVVWKGLTERQWFIGLLVVSGLLLLFTFRGCILPSGVGPKSKPSPKPSATAAPTVQPQAANEYTVEAGDTLSGIAKKTGTTLEALAQANDIDLNNRVALRVGQKLKIPSAAATP